MALAGARAGECFTEINVTPLTDVFLVLLVIMILIAPLVNQTVLKVEPPTVGGTPPPPTDKNQPKLDFTVTATNQILLNNNPVNPPDSTGVTAAIKAEQTKAGKADLPLTLQSDGSALQKYVVSVMDAAAGCGIKNLRVLPLKNK
jgi:biopolymer transport protein ExbD/biopolymer transport protein TolR